MQVAFLQRSRRFHGTGVFGQHVANTFCHHLIQLVRDFIELSERDITQRRLLEEARTGFALLAAGVVLAAHQGAFEITVDDDHRRTFRQAHRFGAQ